MTKQTLRKENLAAHYACWGFSAEALKSESFGDSAFMAIDTNRHVSAVCADDDPEVALWLTDQEAAGNKIIITSKKSARELFDTQLPVERVIERCQKIFPQ